MTWADEGLWFSLILNGAAMAILIPIAMFLHTNKRTLSIARIFRPNHTVEPKSLRPLSKAEQQRLTEEANEGASPLSLVKAGVIDENLNKENSKEADSENKSHHDGDGIDGAGAENTDPPSPQPPSAFSGAQRTQDETQDDVEMANIGHEDDNKNEKKKDEKNLPQTQTEDKHFAVNDVSDENQSVMGRLLLKYGSTLFSVPPLKRLLSVGEYDWERDDDDTPLRRDPTAELFLAFVKLCLVVFAIIASLSTTWLALVCPFDKYNVQLELQSDPVECRKKTDETSCNDLRPVCIWLDGSRCEPDPQNGLADLSLQNLYPRSSKFWAVGVLALMFALMTLFVFWLMTRSITAYHRRVLQRQLRFALGYRAVVVKGLACPNKKALNAHITEVESTIQIRDPDSKATDVDACFATTETTTIKTVPDFIAGFPGSDPELFRREYLSAHSYFGTSSTPSDEEKKNQSGDEDGGNNKENKSDKKKKKTNKKKRDRIRVGGFMGISGGRKLTPDGLNLFNGRDESTGVSNKIEAIIIEREAVRKFHECYGEYEEAKLAYQDAVADEQQYHADLLKQREICYAKLDEINADHHAQQLNSGGEATTTASSAQVPMSASNDNSAPENEEVAKAKDNENNDDRLVKYEKETLLPPLMGRAFPKCCYKVPIVAYRKDDLLKKGEALNRQIQKNRTTPFCGSAFVIFKDALSAFEFVDIYNKEFGGLCSIATARIAGPYDLIEQINLPINKFISHGLNVVMWCAFAALCLFWSIPVGFLGSLSSLATVPGIGPAFQSFIDVLPTVIVGILTAYLPVIVLAIFNILLPIIIRFMVRMSGSLTSLETDAGVMFRMYLFLVLTGVVFQAALQGGIAQIGSIISDPNKDTIFGFVTSIISPKGGYWFATVISAGCLSLWIGAVYIGPLIMMILLSKRASNQRSYNAFFQRQTPDWPLRYAFTLIPTTIGFFFHVTVPLIGIFVGLFFINMYIISRGIYLDNHAPLVHPDRLVTNFGLSKTCFRGMAVVYLVAAIGVCIVVGLREHTGGLVFCIVAACFTFLSVLHTFSESGKWSATLENVREVLHSSDGTISDDEFMYAVKNESDSSPEDKEENPKNKKTSLKKRGGGNDDDDEDYEYESHFSTNKKKRLPQSSPEAPYGPLTHPKLNDTDDRSSAARCVARRKPYHSIHNALNATSIDMEEDIKAIHDRLYKVVMIWHGEENRIEIEKEKEKELKKEALEMEKAIVKGKYKPYVPTVASAATSSSPSEPTAGASVSEA